MVNLLFQPRAFYYTLLHFGTSSRRKEGKKDDERTFLQFNSSRGGITRCTRA